MKQRATGLVAILLFSYMWSPLSAQPFFDVGGLSMWRMPGSDDPGGAPETQGLFFLALPVRLNATNTLIVAPFYETRHLKEGASDPCLHLHNTCLPVALKHTAPDSSWWVVAAAIVRSVATEFRFTGDCIQEAAYVVGSYRVSDKLDLRAGVYYSNEFFGAFLMPLFGLEWKVNDRLNLSGLVNSSVRLEYRLNHAHYVGVQTKNITNSFFETGQGGYYRLSDNHGCVFADTYLTRNVVWTLEAGHTVLRYMKSREGAPFPPQDRDHFVFKTGIYYRVRFDR